MARPHPDTGSKILDHARDLYLEAGLAGFSMRQVASRVGVTATAIYRHFPTKEALLMAVCQQGFTRFAGALWRALGKPTAEERLIESCRQYRRFALENRAYYRVMFMSSTSDLGYRSMPRQTQDQLGPTFQFLVDRVRECIAGGVLQPGDPFAIAFSIWSHLHGLVSLHLTGNLCAMVPDDQAFEAVYDASLERLWGGMFTTLTQRKP